MPYHIIPHGNMAASEVYWLLNKKHNNTYVLSSIIAMQTVGLTTNSNETFQSKIVMYYEAALGVEMPPEFWSLARRSAFER